MKKLLTSFAAIALVASPLIAEDASTTDIKLIAGASESGGYYRNAVAVAEKLNQRGITSEVDTTSGSDEITLGICSGKYLAGYSQIDAIFARTKEGCNIRPIAKYGDGELAMILFPPKSEYNSLDDLTASNNILVNGIGSGASLFFDTIKSIENGDDGNKSEWAKANGVNDTYDLADAMASFGDIDAAIMVDTLNSKSLATLLSLGWEIGELYDKDINDQLFNNKPLYEPVKINQRVNGVKVKGYGYNVRSYGVVSEKTTRDRELYSILANIM